MSIRPGQAKGPFVGQTVPSGTITGSGTPNTVAKFTGANTIGDSSITDDGAQVSFSLDTFIPTDINIEFGNTAASPETLMRWDSVASMFIIDIGSGGNSNMRFVGGTQLNLELVEDNGAADDDFWRIQISGGRLDIEEKSSGGYSQIFRLDPIAGIYISNTSYGIPIMLYGTNGGPVLEVNGAENDTIFYDWATNPIARFDGDESLLFFYDDKEIAFGNTSAAPDASIAWDSAASRLEFRGAVPLVLGFPDVGGSTQLQFDNDFEFRPQASGADLSFYDFAGNLMAYFDSSIPRLVMNDNYYIKFGTVAGNGYMLGYNSITGRIEATEGDWVFDVSAGGSDYHFGDFDNTLHVCTISTNDNIVWLNDDIPLGFGNTQASPDYTIKYLSAANIIEISGGNIQFDNDSILYWGAGTDRGIRENSGIMEFKDAAGVWTPFASGANVWSRDAGNTTLYPTTAGDDVWLPDNDSFNFGNTRAAPDIKQFWNSTDSVLDFLAPALCSLRLDSSTLNAEKELIFTSGDGGNHGNYKFVTYNSSWGFRFQGLDSGGSWRDIFTAYENVAFQINSSYRPLDFQVYNEAGRAAIWLHAASGSSYVEFNNESGSEIARIDGVNSNIHFPDNRELAFGNTAASPDINLNWNSASTLFDIAFQVDQDNTIKFSSPGNSNDIIHHFVNGAIQYAVGIEGSASRYTACAGSVLNSIGGAVDCYFTLTDNPWMIVNPNGRNLDFVVNAQSYAGAIYVDASANTVTFNNDGGQVDVIFKGDNVSEICRMSAANDNIHFPDDRVLAFGNTAALPDAIIKWDTSPLVHVLRIDAEASSGSMLIISYDDLTLQTTSEDINITSAGGVNITAVSGNNIVLNPGSSSNVGIKFEGSDYNNVNWAPGSGVDYHVSINNTGHLIKSVPKLAPLKATLTDAATIAVDASTGNFFTVTLGGNRTLGAPTNPQGDGQKIVIRVTQDGTGSRTLGYNAIYRFSTDLPSPTLSTGAGDIDYLAFIYHSTDNKWDFIGKVFGF